ncbi:MAG: hypothetical protein NZ853_01905 [Leptospiraceae bacterium]|nr:hypothetical protein [Leptospiraceae bacterium]MDW7976019.1 hypothetical protein [Leptospiraceae bacterium]
MNIHRFKKILKEVLIRSCTTEQLTYIGREADPNFNLREQSGYGPHVVIPKQVAADIVLEYFDSEYEILNFVSTLLQYEGKGISGGAYSLREKHKIHKFLEEEGLYYDENLRKFISIKDRKKEDWGVLEDGTEYRLSLFVIDVVSSSELIKTNVKIDIENTLIQFHNFVQNIIELYDGRIWQWHGDGGLIAFLHESGISKAIRAGLQIIYQLPIFNLTKNQLRWENQISVRIAIHFGSAIYRKNLELTTSEDIELTKYLEHYYGSLNAIIITESAFNLAENELKKFFKLTDLSYKNQALWITKLI